MCLDASPRVISPSSLPLQAVPAAAGKSERCRQPPATPGQPTPRPPPPRGARAPPVTLSPPHPGPSTTPKTECEPGEPEGETAEREAEKGAGANDTAAPKLSASRSYKNLQVFNFLPIPDTSKRLQGGIGRDFLIFFLIFWLACFFLFFFFLLDPDAIPPPPKVRSSLPPSSSFSSQASEAADQGGAGGLGAPLSSLPSPPFPARFSRLPPRDDAAGRVELASLPRRRQLEQQRRGAGPAAAAQRQERGAQAALQPPQRRRGRGRAVQPGARQAGQEVRGGRGRRGRRRQQQRRRQPPVVRGAADPAGHGQRAGAAAHAVAERGVRRPAEDHPHAALGQAEQDPDPQAGGQVHRLPLPGPTERRAGLQDGKLQLCGPRAAQLRLLGVEDGGRLVHVRIPLAGGVPHPHPPSRSPR